MAWFRTGGGGIPSVLKEDMNAVLNKKFSTETVYPPETWANNVNLLGKLPEATKSGSVVHFADGADDVPLKSLVANIPANLEGVSSVTSTKAGKNIAKFAKPILDNDRTNHGVTFHATSENTIHISGTATGGTAYMLDAYPIGDSRFIYFKKGTYKLSCNMPDNGNYTVAYMNGYYTGEATTFNVAQNCKINAPKTFTLTKDAYLKIQIQVYNGYSIDDDIWVQIEEGSTATQYTEYIEPEVITSQLGQSIFGGNIDVITGQGLKTWKRVKASDLSLWRRHAQGYFYVINSEVGDKAAGETNILGEDLTTTTISSLTSTPYSIAGRPSDGTIYVYLTGEETLEEFHEWIDEKRIAYEMVTPESFTIQAETINSLYGDNNTIWNDAGDTTVTYRRDIELALQSGPALMMMARPPLMQQSQENAEEANEPEETEDDSN